MKSRVTAIIFCGWREGPSRANRCPSCDHELRPRPFRPYEFSSSMPQTLNEWPNVVLWEGSHWSLVSVVESEISNGNLHVEARYVHHLGKPEGPALSPFDWVPGGLEVWAVKDRELKPELRLGPQTYTLEEVERLYDGEVLVLGHYA